MTTTEEIVWTPADVQREEDRELAQIEQMNIERRKRLGIKHYSHEENVQMWKEIAAHVRNHPHVKAILEKGKRTAVKATDAQPSVN